MASDRDPKAETAFRVEIRDLPDNVAVRWLLNAVDLILVPLAGLITTPLDRRVSEVRVTYRETGAVAASYQYRVSQVGSAEEHAMTLGKRLQDLPVSAFCADLGITPPTHFNEC